MPLFDLFQLGIVHGLYLSLALGALILATLFYDPESWLNDYPPDIRSAFGPMSARARRHQRVAGVLFLVVLIAGLVLGVRALVTTADSVGGAPLSFGAFFLYLLVVLTTFNLVDLVAIDWMLIWLQPKRVVLSGTEGMPGYRDYAFHLRAFAIGLLGSFVGAALVAGALVVWM